MTTKKPASKSDIATQIAEDTGISLAQGKRAADSFINFITDALAKGRSVSLVGFGNFTVAKRKARTGRNPKTGEEIKIKAGKTPKFKAGKTLKDAVK